MTPSRCPRWPGARVGPRRSARPRTASWTRSRRYREVLRPSGLEHELRLLFRLDAGLWGALILFRGPDAPDFSPAEADLLERATSGVAAAIRREMVLTEIAHPHDVDGPGLLLLSDALDPVLITPTARRLADRDRRRRGPGPGDPLRRRDARGTSTGRCTTPQDRCAAGSRARTGQWLTLHAERLAGDPPQVSIIVEPSRPVEIARTRRRRLPAHRPGTRRRPAARLWLLPPRNRPTAQPLPAHGRRPRQARLRQTPGSQPVGAHQPALLRSTRPPHLQRRTDRRTRMVPPLAVRRADQGSVAGVPGPACRQATSSRSGAGRAARGPVVRNDSAMRPASAMNPATTHMPGRKLSVRPWSQPVR